MNPSEVFLRSDLLPWGLSVPIVILVLAFADRRRRQRLVRIAGPRLAALHHDRGVARERWRSWALAAGLLAALVALMQPQGEAGGPQKVLRGVDVVVALDLSRSMRARDLEPDRLGAAQRSLEEFLRAASGDRVGLVGFAGAARVASPLTEDLRSLTAIGSQLDPLFPPRGGTDLGAAITESVALLEASGASGGAIVVLTDGEDHGGEGRRAAARARARGHSVHCVGFGTARGARIPESEGAGRPWILDAEGREVVSRVDPASLRRLSRSGDGSYVDAAARGRPLVELYEDRLLPRARRAATSRSGEARRNLFQWPLIVAFVFLLIELGLSRRGGS